MATGALEKRDTGLAELSGGITESGTWIFTTDQHYENHESSHPQGRLARDHDDWARSNQVKNRLAKRTNAKVVFGDDKECLESFEKASDAFR